MLSSREKRRLRLSLPESFPVVFDVEVDGTLETREMVVQPTYHWDGSQMGDSDTEFDDYPAIMLGWEERGQQIPGEDVLNYFSNRVFEDEFELAESDVDAVDPAFDDDDEVFVDVKEQRYQAELQITPIVETKWSAGVPPQPRLEAMATALWNWVTFEGSRQLNSVGENGERPLVIEPESNPTPSPSTNTIRSPMTAQIRHTASFKEVVPVVQDEEIDANLSNE